MPNLTGGEKVFYTTLGERPPRTNRKKGLAETGTVADFTLQVYNPIAIPQNIKHRAGLPENLLICASRLVDYKGVKTLVSSMAAVADLKWTLWICGDGPGRESISQLIKDLGLQDRICLKGSISYGEMLLIIDSRLC